MQTTNNQLLKTIGRIHTYEEFLSIYEMARQIGFKNINVDLMLGLPNQTLEDLQESLNKVVKLKPEHISVYSLILEEGTALYNKVSRKELFLPNEDLERKMYWYTKKFLEESKYIHYEISNFALKNYKSIHNTDCWKMKEYIGIGAGASSFLDGKRYTNSMAVEEYIHNNKKTLEEILDSSLEEQEYIMLGLRMLEGINLKDFYNKFNIDFFEKFKTEYEKLSNLSLITSENGYIKLTEKGLDFANIVWEEFI